MNQPKRPQTRLRTARNFAAYILAAVLLLAFAPALTPQATAPTVATLRKNFVNPPNDARPMVRWWWFGTAVVKPEILTELEQMKADGIQGAELAFELLRGGDVDRVEAAKAVGIDRRSGIEQRIVEREQVQVVDERGRARGCQVAVGTYCPYDLDPRQDTRHPRLPRREERDQCRRLRLPDDELDNRRRVEVDGA